MLREMMFRKNRAKKELYKGEQRVLLAILVVSFILQASYFAFEYLLIYSLTCIALIYIFARKKVIEINPKIAALTGLLVLVYILASFFSAGNRYLSFQESIKMICVFLFLIGVSPNDKEMPFKALLYSGVILSIFGTITYLGFLDFSDAVLDHGHVLRSQSIVQYANLYAVICGCSFMSHMYFMEKNDNDRLSDQLKTSITSFLLITSMFLTFSRAAVILFTIVLIIMLLTKKKVSLFIEAIVLLILTYCNALALNNFAISGKKHYGIIVFLIFLSLYICLQILMMGKRKKINELIKYSNKYLGLGIATVLLIFIITSIVYKVRLVKISLGESTLVERFVQIKDGTNIFLENLLLGIGPGSWNVNQSFYKSASYNVRYIHSFLVQIGLDAGIFAVIIIFIIFGLVLGVIVKYNVLRDSYKSAAITILAFLLMHSMIDVDLSFLPVLIVVALIISSITISKDEIFSINISPIYKKIMVILVCGAFLAVGVIGFGGQLCIYIAEANFKIGNFERSCDYYQKSMILRPFDAEPYLGISKCYFALGNKRDEVEILLEKAHELSPYEPVYLQELINYAAACEKYKLAYYYSKRLLEISPMDDLSYLNSEKFLSIVYMRKEIDVNKFNEESLYLKRIKQKVSNQPIYTIKIDGELLMTDVLPINIDGRILVPFRAIFEKFRVDIFWDGSTKTVSAKKNSGESIELKVDDKNARVNGVDVRLDVPVQMKKGRVLVPLRFITERLGATVYYDDVNRIVNISTK